VAPLRDNGCWVIPIEIKEQVVSHKRKIETFLKETLNQLLTIRQGHGKPNQPIKYSTNQLHIN
jgi:hypothetical protein